MPFNIFGANSVSGYTVKNSLRFNSGSSDSLSRTMSATGSSRTTFTISTWFKLSSLTSTNIIFSAGDSNNFIRFYIGSTSRIGIEDYNTTAYTLNWDTPSTGLLLRDPSAWYHLVFAVDTTQATASNRVKVYINGNNISSNFTQTTTPSLNAQMQINNGGTMYFGYSVFLTVYFSGYQSENYFINGQQLDPSSFGETDTDTGIWKPKAYTGTYGTNGFYLKFANSASLGTDSSGNGNNFTVNNLTSIDQTTDTPTNNFATMNPLLNRYSSGTGYLITFSEGNLKTTADNTSAYTNTGGTFQLTQGKWYWEAKNGGTGYTPFPTACSIGIHDLAAGFNGTAGTDTLVRGYNADGTKNSNDSTSSYGTSFVSGDIIMVALDLDNGKIWFGKNGTWQNSGSPTGGTNAAFTDLLSVSATGWSPWTQGYRGSSGVNVVFDWNFGNPPYSANSYTDGAGYGNFSYAVPSGYYALCTKNLANFG